MKAKNFLFGVWADTHGLTLMRKEERKKRRGYSYPYIN